MEAAGDRAHGKQGGGTIDCGASWEWPWRGGLQSCFVAPQAQKRYVSVAYICIGAG